MKARILLLVLTGALLAPVSVRAPASAQTAVAPPAPAINSAAGILLDAETGKILWSKEDQLMRAPASLTKIMTALVVLEKGSLDRLVAISPEARYAPGARTYAEEGWTFTVRDLLWGLLLQSGNDAAIALAQATSADGTIEGFAKMMNDRAASIGASQTQFMNPHGYDQDGHYTTARDMALIAQTAMKNVLFAEMVAAKTREVPWGDGGRHLFINHNKLLNRYPGTVGIKTGFTDLAGHSLASAVRRDGTLLIAVLLGSPAHYDESIALYDWGFGNLAALRTQPVGLVRPKRPEPEPQQAFSEGSGIEVVQLSSEDLAQERTQESPTSAPLVAPLAALLLAAGASTMVVRSRRRRQRKADLMSEFARELSSIKQEVATAESLR